MIGVCRLLRGTQVPTVDGQMTEALLKIKESQLVQEDLPFGCHRVW